MEIQIKINWRKFLRKVKDNKIKYIDLLIPKKKFNNMIMYK